MAKKKLRDLEYREELLFKIVAIGFFAIIFVVCLLLLIGELTKRDWLESGCWGTGVLCSFPFIGFFLKSAIKNVVALRVDSEGIHFGEGGGKLVLHAWEDIQSISFPKEKIELEYWDDDKKEISLSLIKGDKKEIQEDIEAYWEAIQPTITPKKPKKSKRAFGESEDDFEDGLDDIDTRKKKPKSRHPKGKNGWNLIPVINLPKTNPRYWIAYAVLTTICVLASLAFPLLAIFYKEVEFYAGLGFSIPFGGFAVYKTIQCLQIPYPILQLTSEGVLHKISKNEQKFIRWDQIEKFKLFVRYFNGNLSEARTDILYRNKQGQLRTHPVNVYWIPPNPYYVDELLRAAKMWVQYDELIPRPQKKEAKITEDEFYIDPDELS